MLDVAVQTRGTTAFVPRTLTAPAGEITIAFTNPSSTPHDLAIAGGGVRAGPTTSVSGGYAAELTVDLPPGTYTYFCTMPGHRQAGMTGTLTVR
jgi:plastocyanin